jgi:hypothetical protein
VERNRRIPISSIRHRGGTRRHPNVSRTESSPEAIGRHSDRHGKETQVAASSNSGSRFHQSPLLSLSCFVFLWPVFLTSSVQFFCRHYRYLFPLLLLPSR